MAEVTNSSSARSSAPDFEYTTASGERRHLAELWGALPTLVLWLRHFG